MKFNPLLVFGLGAFTAAAASSADNSSHLTQMADTFMKDGVGSNYGYQVAVLYMGFEKAYELTKDPKYLDWIRKQLDGSVVQEDGSIKKWDPNKYILDVYRIGNNFLYLHEETKEEKYKTAAGHVRKMYDSHPKSPLGGFWHSQFFKNQMWLDGLFMGQPFLAKWTSQYDASNQTAWDTITHQFDLIDTHARNSKSGLIPHGWADGTAPWANKTTGLAPHVWGRGLGWYFMALLEVLQYLPKSHPKHETMMGYYTSLAKEIKKRRSPVYGSWWQVMERPYPGDKDNFIESSASAMFTYGILKGVKLGYLDKETYLDQAKKAYQSLAANFLSVREDGYLTLNGTVDECNLANGDVNYKYYTSRPVKSNHKNGVGPFMLASYEWETWAKDS